MSVARIKTSAFAARKGATLRCQKCGRDIAKGETYRWWFKGFRSRFKNVRCMTCPAPRTSELESSNLAEAYAAIETAEDELAALGGPGEASDIDAIVNQAGESIREVADQYREADEAFGGYGATQSAEYADNLESAADELENFQAEEFDQDDDKGRCEEHEAEDSMPEDCDACIAKLDADRQEWWDEQVQAAQDAISNASF